MAPRMSFSALLPQRDAERIGRGDFQASGHLQRQVIPLSKQRAFNVHGSMSHLGLTGGRMLTGTQAEFTTPKTAFYG